MNVQGVNVVKSQTSPRDLSARERATRALELRIAGANYDQIAKALGYRSRSGAYMAVKRAIRELNQKFTEAAEEVLRLELARLDELMMSLWPRARQGDVQAVDRVLKIIEKRARLLGLEKMAVTVTLHGAEIEVKWADELHNAVGGPAAQAPVPADGEPGEGEVPGAGGWEAVGEDAVGGDGGDDGEHAGR